MYSYVEEALIALKRKMPDDCDAEYQQVKKNNGVVRDGFVIHKIGKSIAPTFYLTDKEKERLTPDEFAEQIVKHLNDELEYGVDFNIECLSDADWVRKHMIFDIVNRKRNEGMNYANVPLTDDLMVAFKVCISSNSTVRLTDEHIKLWGLKSANSILKEAINNAVDTDKPVFRSVGDVLLDILVDEYKSQYPDVPEDEFRSRIKKEMFGGIDDKVFVLSTENFSNAAMLYPGMLEDIRKKLNDNLVILPSSTKEVLIMREADALSMGLDNVRAMVQQVNRDVVMQDNVSDYLSDEILRFDGELKQIDIFAEKRESLVI